MPPFDSVSVTDPRTDPPAGSPPWFRAFKLGFAQCCPNCGQKTLYRRYLKVNATCPNCGLDLGEIRADDAPPYFTILIVGHIIVPSMLLLERLQHPPEWVHTALWIPLTLFLTLYLLPRVKGVVIALHWANKIRG